MEKNDITQISIKDYLEGIGIPTRKEGHRYFASSPFSHDSNWSFCIYPTNTYFDWSTGHGGNIINLVSRLYGVSLTDAAKQLHEGIKHEKYKSNYKQYQQEPISWEEFRVEKYATTRPEEVEAIKVYAEGRGITSGYFPGVFFTRDGKHWKRNPAVGLLHKDKNFQPCGAKFRAISNTSQRYSARGRLHFFEVMTSIAAASIGRSTSEITKLDLKPPVLYVIEGEINAISLNQYGQERGESWIILSPGGVADSVSALDLPNEYKNIPIKLIIDYDGNEELYQQRLKLYEPLKAQPIKMILPKGEDINSLYNQNKMWMIERLLLN